MKLLLNFLILFGIVPYLLSFNDLTLECNERGEGVVDAVVDKIESSCLFIDDKFMLKRLAYAQSAYGTRNYTNANVVHFGGIWRISREQFADTKRFIHLETVEKIHRRYHIDWKSVVYEQLNRPFYSGLAAILYLERLIERRYIENIPLKTEDQALIYRKYIKQNATDSDFDYYKSKSKEMESGCKLKKPADVFILVDESGSIEEHNFQMIKHFLVNFTRNFNLGTDNTKSRISIATFSNAARLSYNFTSRQTNREIENHIFNMPYRKGRTNTAAGLELMLQQVVEHRRPAVTGIPLIVLVITDGASNEKAKTIEAAKKVHNEHVLVFALGIGNKRNLDIEELHTIASTPVCLHTFLLNTFNDLQYFTKIISKEFLEAPQVLSGRYGTYHFSHQLAPNENFVFQTTLSDSGTNIEIKERDCRKTIAFYMSYTVTKPTEALYDNKTIINCTAPFQGKFYPFSESKDRIYGTIRIVETGRRSRRQLRPFEDDEDEEFGSGFFDFDQDCYPSTIASRIPVSIVIKGNGPCPLGFYGEACDKKCNCRGNVSCSSTTGECPNGACKNGYYGIGCQRKCPDNTYSYLCSKKCHCLNGAQCDLETGQCPENKCEIGWTNSDCQTYVCHNKNGFYFPDDDFCDRFWYCSSNAYGQYGQLVTCPSGLFWEENTGLCKLPDQLIKKCNKGSTRWFKSNNIIQFSSTFAKHQYNVYQFYKSLNTTQSRTMFNLDDEDESFMAYEQLNSNKGDYLLYLRKIMTLWDSDPAYDCPMSLKNISMNDLRQLKTSAKVTKQNNRDSYDYGIFRHDPNSCSFYHKCEYVDSTLVQSKLFMCHNSIFNQNLLKCITSYHYKLLQFASTMPNSEARKACNDYLMMTA